MKVFEISNIKDFEKSINGKHIVLFGAGRSMRSFFSNFGGHDFLNNVEYVVDNKSSLQNTVIQVKQSRFVIKSPEYLSKNILSNTAIIVTNRANPEIYAQLDSMNLLNDTVVYSGSLLNDLFWENQVNSVKLPETFRVYDEQKIPKVIHYCWFGGNPIPEQYKEWMHSWKKFCPDYEIVEWNESNYDYKKHPYMEAAYKAKKWAFVTDYARLDIVYNNGGLYFDTDVELIKNMDDFLYQDGFGGFSGRLFATGLGIGARKGLPILKKFMDLYDGKEFVNFVTKSERFEKHIETTPDILTDYINAHGGGYTNGVVCIEDFRIYPAPVLCGLFANKLYLTDKTYAIHHFAGSWVPEK